MQTTSKVLIAKALLLTTAEAASATAALTYTWSKSLQGYQPGQLHYSPTGDYSAIHENFEEGSTEQAAQIPGKELLRLSIGVQSKTLDRVQIQLQGSLHKVMSIRQHHKSQMRNRSYPREPGAHNCTCTSSSSAPGSLFEVERNRAKNEHAKLTTRTGLNDKRLSSV